jgi:hypothetical protein
LPFTDEQIAFVREHGPRMTYDRLTGLFNGRFGTTYTGTAIKKHINKNKYLRKQSRYTEEQKEFVRNLYDKHTCEEIYSLYRDKYGNDISRHIVRNICRLYCKRKIHRYSEDEISYLKSLYGRYRHETIADMFNDKYGIQTSVTMVRQLFVRLKLHRRMDIGETRTTSEGHVLEKVAQGVWRSRHIATWERLHGKVPEGHAVTFNDGDRDNTDMGNLRLITIQEMTAINRNGYGWHDGETLDLILDIIRLRKKALEMSKMKKK